MERWRDGRVRAELNVDRGWRDGWMGENCIVKAKGGGVKIKSFQAWCRVSGGLIVVEEEEERKVDKKR